MVMITLMITFMSTSTGMATRVRSGGRRVAALQEVAPPTRYARAIPRPEARGAVLRKLPLKVKTKILWIFGKIT